MSVVDAADRFDESGFHAIAAATRRLQVAARLPRFPLEAFPARLRLFCENVAETTQTPVELAAVTMLGALSAVSLGAQVDCGNWTEELGLYLLAVMGPASRKSAVMRLVTAPLDKVEKQRRLTLAEDVDAARTAKELAESRRRSLIGRAAKAEDADERRQIAQELMDVDAELRELGDPHHYRLIAGDATAEALGSLLANHGRIAVISDEGAFLDNVVGGRHSDGQSNLHNVCQAWSGSPIRVDRRGRDHEHVERPLLTITLAVQDHYLPALVNNDTAVSQGLVSRFAFVTPAPIWDPDLTPAPLDAGLAEEWEATLTQINNLLSPKITAKTAKTSGGLSSFGSFGSRKEIGVSESLLLLSLTPQAADALLALRAEIGPKLPAGRELGHIADWAFRHPGRVARIAGLLHLAAGHGEKPITGETMKSAMLIGDFLMAHGRAALEGPDATMRRAHLVLDGWEKDSITEWEIRRHVLNSRKGSNPAAVAAALVEEGRLEPAQAEKPGPRGGRPRSPTYKINR